MSVSFATAAFAFAVLALPLTFVLHHRHAGYGMTHGGGYNMGPGGGGYPMGPGGAGYGMMHAGGGMPVLWHVGMLLAFVLWAGVAGAIVAAVYNAVAGRRA